MRTSPNATPSAQPWVRRQRLQVNLEKRNKTQTEKRVAASRVKKHLALGALCALDIGATLPPQKKKSKSMAKRLLNDSQVLFSNRLLL